MHVPGVKDGSNDPRISEVYCPINGQFSFSYSLTSDTEPSSSCSPSSSFSTLSNCPYGFGLSLDYRGCSFPDQEVSPRSWLY